MTTPFLVLIAGQPVGSPVSAIQSGIAKALAGSACALVVAPYQPGNREALGEICRVIEGLKPLGAILPSPVCDDGGLAAVLRQAGCSQVSIAPDVAGEPARLICSNDRQGMCDAANYLIALGHRRIGFVSISDESRTARELELGFIDALAQHGLDFGAELVVPADDSAEGGRDAAMLLAAVSPRPSAILASSDAQAAGVMQAARLLGIAIPDALSVMGFGDGDLASALAPSLTTMRVPYAEMGFTAAVKLLDPARAERQPVEFFCELVPRGSTAALR